MSQMPLGDDSLSDDKEIRVHFLVGRVHASLMMMLFGYESLNAIDDPDVVFRNVETGRLYRIKVEEMDD